MSKIKVVNIKCGGCAAGIKSALSKKGFKKVKVDPNCQLVEFEGDPKTAEKILLKMGYPKAGSREAESVIKKAQSYASCMIGKTKKKING